MILNRLNRIKGQISGIEKMIYNNCECNDVLIQTVAVEKSAKSLANFILENHLYNDNLYRKMLKQYLISSFTPNRFCRHE